MYQCKPQQYLYIIYFIKPISLSPVFIYKYKWDSLYLRIFFFFALVISSIKEFLLNSNTKEMCLQLVHLNLWVQQF